MPARSRTSFQKRQKELLRAEKQRDKAARRQARKLLPKEDGEVEVEVVEVVEGVEGVEGVEAAAGSEAQPELPENPQDSNAVSR